MTVKTSVIDIINPDQTDDVMGRWTAEYRVIGNGSVRIVQIDSLSSITVIVSKAAADWYLSVGLPPYYSYYIAIPNFNIATEGHKALNQTDSLTNDLVGRGMPVIDALTVVQVLREEQKMFDEETEDIPFPVDPLGYEMPPDDQLPF